ILAITAVFVVLTAPAGAQSAGKAQPVSWAQPQIKLVVSHGLMASSVQTFRPNDTLTRGALTTLVGGLTSERPPVTDASTSTAPVTIAQLDSTLVRGLGLSGAAAEFAAVAKSAGLRPPSRFGTEVVARLLGLRTNHPAQLDSLELLPSQPATRAEAAFSAAQILNFRGWEIEQVQELADPFALTVFTAAQTRISKTPAALIGCPSLLRRLRRQQRENPSCMPGHAPARLRLLGVRLGRLPAANTPLRLFHVHNPRGQGDVCEERRGPGGKADHVREAEAGRRPLLGRRRP